MKEQKNIAIGCDHAGFRLKEELKKTLGMEGYEIIDFGCHSEESVDYPDFAHRVAEAVSAGKVKQAVLICGSGNGISMTANKHKNVRAALCWNEEIAALARKHNDANILSLPARFIEVEVAKKILKIFLSTHFEGGRHQGRVGKIDSGAC